MSEKSQNQLLQEKWAGVIDCEGMAPITDRYKRAALAVILENQHKEYQAGAAAYRAMGMINESAPTNSVTSGGVNNYDPILISMIRRTLPNMLPYDVCGVQPMTGPVGLIFAMKSRYSTMSGTEALFNEANTAFSSTRADGANGNVSGSVTNTDPTLDFSDSTVYGVGAGMTTANGEQLGTGTSASYFPEMAFSIDKISVTARERALAANFSMELAQDLKAIHGLDAETELSNILSTEVMFELNREIIRTIYRCASLGAQVGTAVAGTFNMDLDSNGRWLGEKFKGLYFQIERESNGIAKTIRRGKGNILIVSSDVASALAMTGALDYTPAIKDNLTVDDTGNTFAGILGGRTRVYIDPYFSSASGNELCVVGYKGQTNPYDAGLFYCPYVPLQKMNAQDPQSFQPRIGFKCRYGLVANPFATLAGDGVVGDRNNANQANKYYRIFRITNIL